MRHSPKETRSVAHTRDLPKDSDPNRQHYSDKPRLWTWRSSLNFCINGTIPHEFGTTKPFSADLAHITLADIERQFSFEVEQHRDNLRRELIEHKRSLETERMKIQLEQMEIEKETTKLGSLLRETQEVIDSITKILVGAPQTKGKSETATGFSARKAGWSTREEIKVHQLNALFERYEIVVAEKSTHIDEAMKLRETLSKRQAELSGEIEHMKRRMSEGEQKTHDIERDVSSFERQLSTVSTTINAATVGISIIVKKSVDPNYIVLFSPLCLGEVPIVFSSSALAEMESSFFIVPPQRRDFAYNLARSLDIEKGPYAKHNRQLFAIKGHRS